MTVTAHGKFYFFDLHATGNCVSTCRVKWLHSSGAGIQSNSYSCFCFIFFKQKSTWYFLFLLRVSPFWSLSAKGEAAAGSVGSQEPHLLHSHPITGWGTDWEEQAGNTLFSREIYSWEAAMRNGQWSGCLQRCLSAARWCRVWPGKQDQTTLFCCVSGEIYTPSTAPISQLSRITHDHSADVHSSFS